MMFRGFLAFACLVVTAPMAMADLTYIGGSYAVAGTNPNGSPYEGQAEITYVSDTTCEIEWLTEGVSSFGICMRLNTTFAVSYSLGEAVGLVIYNVNDDGSMDGAWTVAGQDGVGTEILVPMQ